MLRAPVVTIAGRLFPVHTRYTVREAPAVPAGTLRASSVSLLSSCKRHSPRNLATYWSSSGRARNPPRTRVPGFGRPRSGSARAAAIRRSSQRSSGCGACAGATGHAQNRAGDQHRRDQSHHEGVRIVVDSGLMRRMVFDPATGMSRLETERISRASAEQRQGRAGHLAPACAIAPGAHRRTRA